MFFIQLNMSLFKSSKELDEGPGLPDTLFEDFSSEEFVEMSPEELQHEAYAGQWMIECKASALADRLDQMERELYLSNHPAEDTQNT